MLGRSDPALVATGSAAVGFALSPTIDTYGLIFIGAICGSIISLCGRATTTRLEAFKSVTKSILLSMLLTTVAAKMVAGWLGSGWDPGELIMAVAGVIALFADLVIEYGRRKIHEVPK